MYCESFKVKKFGKTTSGHQRYRCLKCFRTYVYKRKDRKVDIEQCWFRLWVKEGFSIRQLSQRSGHSEYKLKSIKNYWLSQEPPSFSQGCYAQIKYLLFDGTYFHKAGCLAIIMDVSGKKIISSKYIDRECYASVYPILVDLKTKGLNPRAITTDGHRTVIQAILTVWPKVEIQRCLFHIQNQGLMWIRSQPKTQAGSELRLLLRSITSIKNDRHQQDFLNQYKHWFTKYEKSIKKLSATSIASKDLKRTMTLVNNALPNMFHFIKDPRIASTTNLLENLFSQLKHQYRNHRGLSELHKIQFLKWYCFFKNTKK